MPRVPSRGPKGDFTHKQFRANRQLGNRQLDGDVAPSVDRLCNDRCKHRLLEFFSTARNCIFRERTGIRAL